MTTLREEMGVRYALCQSGDIEEMAELLAVCFGRHEPMAIASGYTHRELVDFVKLFGPMAVAQQLTPVARDVASGEMVGAFLTEDFCSPAPDGFALLGEKFQPTLTMLAAMDDEYRKGRDVHPGGYLHLFMVGVGHAHGGRKIGQNLLAAALDNGVRRGYRMAVTEATGTVSQAIFRRAGFIERLTVRYKEYVYKGRRVFETIEGHIGTILMDRDLGA